jgi:hypothetical protein
VLTPTAKGWRKVAQTSVSRMPIWRLPSKHHGWSDLAVSYYGGGKRGMGAIRFNGRRYASNPTTAPRISSIPKGAALLIRGSDSELIPIPSH